MSISNLTNTTWVINNFTLKKIYAGNYSVNYTYGDLSYGAQSTLATMSILRLENGGGPPEEEYAYIFSLFGTCAGIDGQSNIKPTEYANYLDGYIIADGVYSGTTTYFYTNDTSCPWGTGAFINDKTIRFLGGTDATNANLIAWLEENATQVQPVATVEYDGDILTSIPANTTVTFNTAGRLMASSITITTGSGGSSPTLIGKTITANGTYNASSDNADGYDQVTVNVAGPTYNTTSRASATHVLSGYYFYYPNSTSTVTRTAGSMTNRGAVAQTLTVNGASYTIPAGYHNGSGHVYVNIPVYDGSVIGGGLAGTTWLLNSTPTAGGLPDGSNSFDVNYTFDGLTVNSVTPTLTTFDIGLQHYGPTGTEYLWTDLSGTCSAIQGAYDYNVSPSEFVSTLSMMFDPKDGYYSNTVYIYSDNSSAPFSGWTFNNRIISFIDGDDINNSDLIAWLEANAVQQ